MLRVGLIEVLLVVVIPLLTGMWQARRDLGSKNENSQGPMFSLFKVALLLGGSTACLGAILQMTQGSSMAIVAAGLVVFVAVLVLGAIPSLIGYRLAYHLMAASELADDAVVQRPGDSENPYRSSAV